MKLRPPAGGEVIDRLSCLELEAQSLTSLRQRSIVLAVQSKMSCSSEPIRAHSGRTTATSPDDDRLGWADLVIKHGGRGAQSRNVDARRTRTGIVEVDQVL